jgi:hypothetical protein
VGEKREGGGGGRGERITKSTNRANIQLIGDEDDND